MIVVLGARRDKGPPRRTDRIGIGMCEGGHQRIPLGRRTPFHLRRQRICAFGELLFGQDGVVGRRDQPGLSGDARHLVDAAGPRPTGTDRLEFADQPVASGHQIRDPGKLMIKPHKLIELSRPRARGVHRDVQIGEQPVCLVHGVDDGQVVGNATQGPFVGGRMAVHGGPDPGFLDGALLRGAAQPAPPLPAIA